MDYSTLLFVDCKTTIWEKTSDQPPGHTNEIIGVDIALVDTNKNQIIEQEITYIKPKKSKISHYCEKLFGIKQSQLDENGVPFADIYRRLRIHYMSRDRLWAGWGLYEKYTLDKQCKALELEGLFSQPHHNAQHLYALMTGATDSDNLPTIVQALKLCDLPSEENDAVNAANIYIKMAKGLRASNKTRILVPTSFGQPKQLN